MGALLNIVPEILTSLLGLGLGWFWGRWKSQKDWESKTFHSNIVLSLNMIGPSEKEGYVASLKLRTIFENQLADMFPLPAMQSIIRRAIETTSEENPLMEFPEKDSWYVLNTVLNHISEIFAPGLMKKDMGGSVFSERYIFCFTFERDGGLRAHKPRIMLFQKKAFLELPMEGEFELENPKFHQTRVKTLRKLRKLYDTKPHLFMEMEIAV